MFDRWMMMSQFDRLRRCVSVSSIVFGDCSHVDVWRCCHHPNFKPSLHEFLYWRLCGMRCEPWVGMCYSCVWVYLLPWRHGYFVNSWGSLLDLGCGSLRCVDIGVMLCMFASFWHCWSFQRCVSSNSWHRNVVSYLYSSPRTSYTWSADLFGDSSERWSFVFTMLSLGWIGCYDIE